MSLNYHYMQLPREVIIGEGALRRIPEVASRLGLKGKALLLSDAQCYKLAGETVSSVLETAGLSPDFFLVKSTTVDDLIAVERQLKELKPRVVFGVGGGTIIDAAKISSVGQNIPFISVPTTVSHDGVASPLASIKGDRPYSVLAHAPLAIIADTEIISMAPWRFVVSGCGDIISKFTAVKDWQLAYLEKGEYYGDYAASLALMSAKLVTKNTDLIIDKKEEGIRMLMEALISCGVSMSIAGSSRPCSGSEHLFSHALDMINAHHAMHGEQCGVGAILTAFLHGSNWQQIRAALQKIGAPVTAHELGVKDMDVVKALQVAAQIRPERYTILHKLNLGFDACETVARATGTIC
ncbi:NAD(P)-dependent glycerol-1-phosphate dehydrogenase [Candidatus Bathycorpusculum sp.]|uniref:NAD(P)-dependent glycerol-1-phosphate dehydrogenase n=1 Tax=Candidatus Bathycorpusculum sp. TaxID=2994959 RepID=UPI00282F2ABF|nr:NAD(P)-dependent glycerol-1-phosphate dehydrogenase [Candidatus Termitimicrobium sp.]MCL2431866.1 NAD(P)-dependent glycerol-1-phosphate dehydrogenase [Candidatus Termitimicrobium sp.]